MEKMFLMERASEHAKRCLPAKINPQCVDFFEEEKTKFDDVSSVHANDIFLKQGKKPRILGLFLMFVFVIGCFSAVFLFASSSPSIKNEIQAISEKLFEPKDLGKIKFTNGELVFETPNEEEAMSMIAGFELPFAVCAGKNIGEAFLMQSAGELLVKCAMDGVVESVTTNEVTFQKTIVVSHGSGLKTMYSMIDTASVKAGDRVKQNTILGISKKGEIGFSVSYKNKVVKGLEIVDGQLSFS